MTSKFAYDMGVLVAQKRAADDVSAEKKPDAKKPEAVEPGAPAAAPDAFAGVREQFSNILGMSPEDMQAQQQMRLALVGRSAPAQAMAQTLRDAFAPMGGA